MRSFKLLIVSLVMLFCTSLPALAECPCRAADPEPPFPAWVFGHVVWEDESTTQSVYELVQGYLEHGVPVDGVIIDSPWETAYNTFEWDQERYPNAQQMIHSAQPQDYRYSPKGQEGEYQYSEMRSKSQCIGHTESVPVDCTR